MALGLLIRVFAFVRLRVPCALRDLALGEADRAFGQHLLPLGQERVNVFGHAFWRDPAREVGGELGSGGAVRISATIGPLSVRFMGAGLHASLSSPRRRPRLVERSWIRPCLRLR